MEDKTHLIRKVLLNQATEQERIELDAWMKSDREHAEQVEDFKILYGQWSHDTDPQYDDDADRPLRQIQKSIQQIKQKERRSIARKTGAWSIAGFIFVGVLYFSYDKITCHADKGHRQGKWSGVKLSTSLSFNDTPLSTVLQVISEKNHVPFTAKSKGLLACKFTGTFYKGTAMKDVMAALAESEGFRYTFEPANVELIGKGVCAERNNVRQ